MRGFGRWLGVLVVNQAVAWLLAGGFAAVSAGVVAVVLRGLDVFTWPLFLLLLVGVLLLAAGVIYGSLLAAKELRILLDPRKAPRLMWLSPSRSIPGRMQITAGFVVTNTSRDRPVRLVSLAAPDGVDRDAFVNLAREYDETDPTQVIEPGATEHVETLMWKTMEESPSSWDYETRLVFTDQYGRKHTTPRVDWTI